MRSEEELEGAIQMVDNRIERDADRDHPLRSVVLAIHQAKRAGLIVARDAQGGEVWEVRDNLDARLTQDLSLPQFVQAQAMKNAIAWATERTDQL